jgi:hypothetical protein
MSFEDILNKPVTEIDRPKPLPVGEYLWTIQGMPRYDKSKEKQTPYYEFKCKCVEALDSVDEDALAEWAKKADGSARKLSDFETRLTFYVTEDSLYRLQEFLVHCGAAEDGISTKQALDNTPNCQFIGSIKHATSNDGTAVYANISKTAPVEE